MYFGPESEEPIRVLVAEDQERARQRLWALLGTCSDIEVVAGARDGGEAVCLASEYRPEVVLMDVHIPGMGVARATRMIKSSRPETAVLALTTDGDLDTDPRDVGADAFLPGTDLAHSVVEAVRDLAVRARAKLLKGMERCKS